MTNKVKFGVLFLTLVALASAYVNAEELRYSSGLDKYSWFKAKQSATNKAKGVCSSLNLVYDAGPFTKDQINLNGHPYWSTVHTYTCKSNTGGYSDQTAERQGDWFCHDGVAYNHALALLGQWCEHLAGDGLLLNNVVVVRRREIPTGSCDGIDDGWDVPSTSQYKLRGTCRTFH